MSRPAANGQERSVAAAHLALGPSLVRSILIGATDWGDRPGGVQPPKATLVGPAPEILFVPDHAAGRLKAERDLGAAMQRDQHAFYAASRAFVTVRRLTGVETMLEGWARVAAGEAPPPEGLVLSF